MSHFSWETEIQDRPQGEHQPEQHAHFETEHQAEPQPEHAHFEPESQQVQQAPVDSAALALSVDDFSALEDRILRAVNLVKRERVARSEAEARATVAEALAAEQGPRIEQLQSEVNTLRAERDHVRQRVERLLSQLDALEL
jgi:hypothetical protein